MISFLCEGKKRKQTVSKTNKIKQTCRYRELMAGYQWGGGWNRGIGKVGDINYWM